MSSTDPNNRKRFFAKLPLVSCLLASLLMFCVLFFAFRFNPRNENFILSESQTYLNNSWVLYNADGQLINPDVTLPFRYSSNDAYVTLTRTLDPNLHTDGIFFHNKRQAIQIFADDQEIFQINLSPSSRLLKVTSQNLVNFKIDKPSKLSFRIYNNGEGPFRLDNVMAATRAELIRHILQYECITIINTFILLVFALFLVASAIFFSTKKHVDSRINSLFAFAFVSVAWCFFDSTLYYLTPISADTAGLLSYTFFLIVPIPAVFYTMSTCRHPHRSLHFVLYLDVVTMLLRFLAAFSGIATLNQTLIPANLVLLVVIGSCLRSAYREMRDRSNEELNFGMFTGFIILFFATVASMMTYFTIEGAAYRFIMLSGMSIFYGSLMVIYLMSNMTELENKAIDAQRIRILEHEANTDKLTGLRNRSSFESRLSEIEKNPAQYSDAVLVMLDLNGLKNTNDTYGHSAGDELIVSAALCIAKTLGSGCSSYCIGGDEFTVILPGRKESETLKSRLNKMERWIRNYNQTALYPLSIAYGYSYFRKPDGELRSISNWKQNADAAMYSNKRAQREKAEATEETP